MTDPKSLLAIILASPADDLAMTLAGTQIPAPEVAGVSITTLAGVTFGLYMTARLARDRLQEDD